MKTGRLAQAPLQPRAIYLGNRMRNKETITYVNDHLAGAVAALELLDHLLERYSSHPLAQFFLDLQREIKSDQQLLRALLDNAEEKESIVRQIAAWITEKFARAKFKIAGEEIGGLGLVQALEMLALGIRGKELLWRALATSNWPPLHDVDLATLEQRAIEQEERVEEKRLEAARAAFG
jgi:hypothetical protein